MSGLNFVHVDVFSRHPYSGNSLAVFMTGDQLEAAQMLRITQEFRHFEAIFLSPTDDANRVEARVFDLFDELPFAGHPIIGAAAVLHESSGKSDVQTWQFDLANRRVPISTERTDTGYFGLLDQGRPDFLGEIGQSDKIARAFDLEQSDLDSSLPLAVVSTGLKYLIVPVMSGVLSKARIPHDITDMLQGIGAQFAVLLDDASLEIRHWNNDGIVEDIATGSAAGTIGAYRLRYQRTSSGETFLLNQGHFMGRPSQLRVKPEGTSAKVSSVKVGGDVAMVGRGILEVLP